jgi:hypothetical protein
VSLGYYLHQSTVLRRSAFLVIIITICAYFPVDAQKLYYDVVKGHKTLGSMMVERSKIGSETVFSVESLVEYRLLLNFKIEYQAEERYINGVLVDGSAVNSLNGKVQKQSAVKWDGEKYVVNLNGELTQVNEKGIVFSIPHLYYNEPVNQKRVFSQQFGGHIPMYEDKPKVYVLDSPDGKNYYTYNAEGICEEVKVSRAYATFYFRLKEKVDERKGPKGKKISDSQ